EVHETMPQARRTSPIGALLSRPKAAYFPSFPLIFPHFRVEMLSRRSTDLKSMKRCLKRDGHRRLVLSSPALKPLIFPHFRSFSLISESKCFQGGLQI